MHPGAQINQSLRSFDQRRQNVGREHLDSKDARNSGLHFHPPLAITDARIVDYSIEAAELVDLVGNCSCPSDGGEVPGDNSASDGCRREGVVTSILDSPVQYDIMALVAAVTTLTASLNDQIGPTIGGGSRGLVTIVKNAGRLTDIMPAQLLTI